jgi:hypothetical protein
MPDLAPPQHTPWVLLLPTGGVRAGAYASSPGAAPDNLLPARPACGTRPCVGVAEWGRVWRPASGPIADSADLAPQLQHVCCSLPDRAPMRHRETRTRTGRRSSGACRQETACSSAARRATPANPGRQEEPIALARSLGAQPKFPPKAAPRAEAKRRGAAAPSATPSGPLRGIALSR